MSKLHRMTRTAVDGPSPGAPSGSTPVGSTPAPGPPATPSTMGNVADRANQILQGAGRILDLPMSAVKTQAEIGNKEREVDVATSAFGMSDETYRLLVTHFTGGRDPNSQEGRAAMAQLGITPEVVQSIGDMVRTLPANWQNPKHRQAVFGAIDAGLRTGGPEGAKRIIRNMSEFYSEVKGRVQFNPAEMLDILAEFQDPNMDEHLLGLKITSFLDRVAIDPEDRLGVIGASPGAEAALSLRAKFRMILGEMSEIPDMNQMMAAGFDRSLNDMLQKLYRGERDVSRRYFNPVGRGMGTIGNMGNWVSDRAGDFQNAGANAFFGALETPVMMMTQGYNLEVPGTAGRWMMNPALRQRMSTGNQAARAAGATRRLVRLAQADNPSPENDVPAFPQDDLSRKRLTLLQQVTEADAAASAQVVFDGRWLSGAEVFRRNDLEANIRRVEGMLSYFLEALGSDLYATEAGVASTEMFGEDAERMLTELTDNIDSLISLYTQVLEKMRTRGEALQQQVREQRLDPEQARLLMMQTDAAYSFYSDVVRQWTQRKLSWQQNAATIIPKMKQRFIETTQSTPLRAKMDLAREQTGGTLGVAQTYVAALYEEIRQLREAQANLTSTVPPERLQAEYAKLETLITQKMAEAQRALNQATGSSISGDQRSAITGVG